MSVFDQNARIEIVRSGLLLQIQDSGRTGYRHLGVPWSGVLIPSWQAMANVLVGNDPQAAVVEGFEGGAAFRIHDAPVRLALCGTVRARRVDASGSAHPLHPWQSYRLEPGSELRIDSAGDFRIWTLALAGLSVDKQLGSASTFASASLGGLNGRELQGGDTLDAAEADKAAEKRIEPCLSPWSICAQTGDEPQVPAIAGPQQDAFSEAELDRFFSSPWTLGGGSDRMGARLEGEPLQHRDAAHRDIVSDAIIPGSVQVPGNGQPIVMLADAHTAGGYPKIATVAASALPLLAALRPGQRLRFQRVDADQARELARLGRETLATHLDSCHALQQLDTQALYLNNLIDGVIDAVVDTGGEPS